MTHTATDFLLLLAWWTRFLHNSSTAMLSRCRPRPQGRSNQHLAAEGFNRRGSACVFFFFFGKRGKRDQKGRGIEYDGKRNICKHILKSTHAHSHSTRMQRYHRASKTKRTGCTKLSPSTAPPPINMSLHLVNKIWILQKKTVHLMLPLCNIHRKNPRHSSLLLHLFAHASMEGSPPICQSWLFYSVEKKSPKDEVNFIVLHGI